MRIEELVLDGFKSYPVRTQITQWDPSFNAITGLNGSGKSNILDAIAFVLGLTNMSTMRAQNQQDLIYKRGQAGVTKASVTIVFDNSDPEKSPPGFQDHKQITVTRQIALPNVTKWLLNGHKSDQGHIQNMFQSVQLNINNPNFVIMQGRITKVLNMRPKEILGMIEEAAGTRMYEEQKAKALKKMEKKDKRVQEIKSILEEEIGPKLLKLQADKRLYEEWKRASDTLDQLNKQLVAAEWLDATESEKISTEEKVRLTEEVQTTKAEKSRLEKEISDAKKRKAEVEKRREAEKNKGGKLAALEEEVKDLDKDLAKMRTQEELKQQNIKDEQGRIVSERADIKDLGKELAEKQKTVDALQKEYTRLNDDHKEQEAKLRGDENLLTSLLTGLTSDGNTSGGGYRGQIQEAQNRAAEYQTKEQQNVRLLKDAEARLPDLEKRWKAVEREAGDGKRKVNAMESELEHLEVGMANCGWDEGQEQALEEQIRGLKNKVTILDRECADLKRSMGGLSFDYQSPSPHFDRRKVKGRIGTLVELKKEHEEKATALELAAGGRLYNVVVDDERIGKDLLNVPGIPKITLIPLNKISNRKMDPHKVQYAQNLAPGKVFLALSLISYDPEVSNAMAFVFGNTFICEDSETAKRVTFDKRVNARSVTWDGDVYEPGGTLSGGSAPNSSGILVRAQQFIQKQREWRKADEELRKLQTPSGSEGQKREQWLKYRQEIGMKRHELELLTAQTSGSDAAIVGEEVAKHKQKIAELRETIQDLKTKQADTEKEIKKLKKDMEEYQNNKGGKVEELKDRNQKGKAALQQHSTTVKAKQKEVQNAGFERDTVADSIAAKEQEIKEIEEGILKSRSELAQHQKEIEKIQIKYNTKSQRLQSELASLKGFEEELQGLEEEIQQCTTLVKEASGQVDKAIEELETCKQELAGAQRTIKKLEKDYDWIAEESSKFDQPPYYYNGTYEELLARKEGLEKTQSKQKKKLNPKAVHMYEEVKKKDDESRTKLRGIQNDKLKIEETLQKLDNDKRSTLEKTWGKVTKDFGGIFAELLPGNMAKLQPPEGQDLMDGLEVKVRLGSVWKQSLTELSGGQRSLIALSLIMALLQFKPAPMYILDEIDSALDLQHTQHIGHLFRTRFKGAQFIVVSLKEGLYANASVIFKARFRDGTSVVERVKGA